MCFMGRGAVVNFDDVPDDDDEDLEPESDDTCDTQVE